MSPFKFPPKSVRSDARPASLTYPPKPVPAPSDGPTPRGSNDGKIRSVDVTLSAGEERTYPVGLARWLYISPKFNPILTSSEIRIGDSSDFIRGSLGMFIRPGFLFRSFTVRSNAGTSVFQVWTGDSEDAVITQA